MLTCGPGWRGCKLAARMTSAPVTLADIRGKATIPVWPDAGQIIGLGRNASYAAAAAGSIPTLRFGNRLVVPTAKLLALLGIEDTGSPEQSPAHHLRAVTDAGENEPAA